MDLHTFQFPEIIYDCNVMQVPKIFFGLKFTPALLAFLSQCLDFLCFFSFSINVILGPFRNWLE